MGVRKKPDYKLIEKFLELEEPHKHDFKLELRNEQLNEFYSPLERMLYFKRKCVGGDPDCCDLVMSIMCVLLDYNGIENEGYEGRSIYLPTGEDKKNKIETDTAYSFISLYKGALQENLPNYWELCRKYGMKGSFTDAKVYEKFYAHRDEFSLRGYNDSLLEQFDTFAYLTHSIGNFWVGPEGFNCKDPRSKASEYKKVWDKFDRVDLFLDWVARGETYPEWEQWFGKNGFSTYTDFFYNRIVTSPGTQEIDLKESELINLDDSKNLTDRLQVINNIILSRGKRMVMDLADAVYNSN